MIKTLTKHGNSMALVIDKAILELLDINEHTHLSIRTDGKCLIISPAPDEADERRFKASLRKLNKRYNRALKRLAD